MRGRTRAGAALLFVGLVCIVLLDALGPAGLFLSWGFAGAGLLVLRREVALRRASQAGLLALFISIVLGATLAGITIGSRGRVLASTPTLDPAFAVAAIGFVAAWAGAAAFLVVHERRAGQRSATVAGVLLVLGALLFVGMQLKRLALGDGAVLTITLGGGGLLLLFSLARFAWRPLTARAG